MSHANRIAEMTAELNARVMLFNRYPCKSYYRAVDRQRRKIARLERLGYVQNWEKKS